MFRIPKQKLEVKKGWKHQSAKQLLQSMKSAYLVNPFAWFRFHFVLVKRPKTNAMFEIVTLN
jgi:hypothetical protein